MNAISLQPERQEWTIGGKQYAQEPFGLDRTSELFKLVAAIFEQLTKSGDVERLTKIDPSDPSAGMSFFSVLAMMAPTILESFLALCLDVTDPTEKKTIFKKCSPATAMGIVNTFIKQNDVNEIIQTFLELRKSLSQVTFKAPNSESTT